MSQRWWVARRIIWFVLNGYEAIVATSSGKALLGARSFKAKLQSITFFIIFP